MRLVLSIILAIIFVTSVMVSFDARALESPTKEQVVFKFKVASTTPVVPAKSFVVMDIETGAILASNNEKDIYPLASVAKLFVAGALLKTGDLTATTTITDSDINTPEDFGQLHTGEEFCQRDLLYPYLLESSNDAGTVIEREWGEEVRNNLDYLLKEAKAEDMKLSDFTGLSADTEGSALAVANLTRYLFLMSPHLFDITTLPRFKSEHALLSNSNPLQKIDGFRGGKQGYTNEALRTFSVVADVDFGDGVRPILFVALGADNHLSAYEALRSFISSSVTRTPSLNTSAILSAPTSE